MSHTTGEPVQSIAYALHHLAEQFGTTPWALRAEDPPADEVLQALAINRADSEGRRKKAALESWRRDVRAGRVQ